MPRNVWKMSNGGVPDSYSEQTFLRTVRLASHHVKDLVSPELSSALEWWAVDGRTKAPAMLQSLMALTASVIGGHIALKQHPDVNHHITPALMMLTVGGPGSGKSYSVDTGCVRPLSAIQTEHQRKIFDRPANSSSLRRLIKDTSGKCSVIGDEFNKILTDLTTGQGGAEPISFLNSGWSGGRLTASYSKATSFDLSNSCITCYGAIHPPTLATMIQTWMGGEGLKERWLFSVIGDDVVDARTCLQQKLEASEPPFDILATFRSLYDFCQDLSEMLNLVLSDDALEKFLEFSEQVAQEKKARREAIGKRKSAHVQLSSAKDEEQILKVSQVFHVLEAALSSFKNLGQIEIPVQVSLETLERAISYVQTSKKVLRLFTENKAFCSEEAEILMLPGTLLTPATISEATRQRNKFSFAEPKQFLKITKKLQQMGIGQIVEMKIKRGGHTYVEDVYFKPPPSESLSVALSALELTLDEYEEQYRENHSMRPSQTQKLGRKVALYEMHSPYSSNAASAIEDDSDIEESDQGVLYCSESDASDSQEEDQPPLKKRLVSIDYDSDVENGPDNNDSEKDANSSDDSERANNSNAENEANSSDDEQRANNSDAENENISSENEEGANNSGAEE